ncbi:hypothetical protein GOP47_0016334 [Adiantum capillus-veneris]|uniref:Uncharacterized protein n=1 Tax=Adiantum capillus-veneris TaxID=13818 RepID=A0A9D4ZAN0_ADICA|nr:hypothetical protein GOP47_0016334 [Adiantum capillus-veneris]
MLPSSILYTRSLCSQAFKALLCDLCRILLDSPSLSRFPLEYNVTCARWGSDLADSAPIRTNQAPQGSRCRGIPGAYAEGRV